MTKAHGHNSETGLHQASTSSSTSTGYATDAVPGLHRADVLQLPSQPLPRDPNDAVTVLRSTGARRALILTKHGYIPSASLVSDVWIDRLLILRRDPEKPSLIPVGDTVSAVPKGWVLDALTPVSGGIITEYRRAIPA